MKSKNFTGRLIKNSRILRVHSGKQDVGINEKFNIRIQDENFSIEKIEKKEKWFDFSKEVNHEGDLFLMINDSKEDDIIKKDMIEILLPEYAADTRCEIINQGKGYSPEDVIQFEKNEGKVFIKPISLDVKGSVKEAKIINEKNFLYDDDISARVFGGSGEDLEVRIKLHDSRQKRKIYQQVKDVIFRDGKTYFNLEYDLISKIEKGSIIVSRTEITLKEPSLKRSYLFANCIAEKYDFTPKYNIPIVEPGTINAPLLFNEGARIIEKKIIELENKIRELEKRI